MTFPNEDPIDFDPDVEDEIDEKYIEDFKKRIKDYNDRLLQSS